MIQYYELELEKYHLENELNFFSEFLLNSKSQELEREKLFQMEEELKSSVVSEEGMKSLLSMKHYSRFRRNPSRFNV